MNPLLANRPMSGFPLSISTGMALETIFDPITEVYDTEREVVKPITNDYTLYLINVSTLLRNLINSVPFKNYINGISKKDVIDALIEEMDFLSAHFSNDGKILKFYHNTYKYVKDTYGDKKILRVSHTDKQYMLDDITTFVMNKVKLRPDVELTSKDIPSGMKEIALVLTHVPYDLLSYDRFRRLDLLESHTGIIKTRKDWNTKYFPVPKTDLSFLPLNEYLLTVLGDNVMFKPDALSVRLSTVESMKKNNVTPLTTEYHLGMKYIMSKN